MVQQVVEICAATKVQDAYDVRRELCNYKKVCLHILTEAALLEKDLRQQVGSTGLAALGR